MINWIGLSPPMIEIGWLIAFTDAALNRNMSAVSLVKVDEGFD